MYPRIVELHQRSHAFATTYGPPFKLGNNPIDFLHGQVIHLDSRVVLLLDIYLAHNMQIRVSTYRQSQPYIFTARSSGNSDVARSTPLRDVRRGRTQSPINAGRDEFLETVGTKIL